MPAYLSEFASFAVGTNRGTNPAVPQEPCIACTPLSSGSSGTSTGVSLSGRTNIVVITPTVNFWGLFASSTSSTTSAPASSTNAEFFPSGVATVRGVAPNMKFYSFST